SQVLFSTAPDELGLYGKPMARNAQVWTNDYRLLLDGPRHGKKEIERAEMALDRGGQFGYRFVFPAMRVGPWEVYWQRPLAVFAAGPETPALLEDAPLGYLTAYPVRDPDLARPVELWPRLLRRELHADAVDLFADEHRPRVHLTTFNVRGILE